MSRRDCWLIAGAYCLMAGWLVSPAAGQFGPPANQGSPRPNTPGFNPGTPAPAQSQAMQPQGNPPYSNQPSYGQPLQGQPPYGQPGVAPPAGQQPVQATGGGNSQQFARPRQQVPLPPQSRAPFELSQAEFDQLWSALKAWEAESDKVEIMRCKLLLWEYDGVFNNGKPPVREGDLQYAKPDKGLYRMLDVDGKKYTDHWLCDGRSVFQYDYDEQKLTEFTLPPELQGQGISNGPMPFLFGAKADQMLKRYFLRVVTPANLADKQVWIEAYPRYQQDAANFKRATAILNKDGMRLFAVELYATNGKSRTVHQFDKVVINDRLNFIRGSDFEGVLPRGWTKVVNPQGNPSGPPPGTPTAQRIDPPQGPLPPR